MTGGATLAWPVLDEPGLNRLATQLAPVIRTGGVVYLFGDLGAGKTTFARALLGALGVQTRVKSPTYTLIESYDAGALSIHHLDLYRIADPGELEWLGLADLLVEPFLALIEWPERGGAALPAPDLTVRLAHAGAARDVACEANSERGRNWIRQLSGAKAARNGEPAA